MLLNMLSTLESSIYSVQLKLSDYISKSATFKDGIISTVLPSPEKRKINDINELILHVGNHFEIRNPHCPACDSRKVIKQEYYPRKLKLAELGVQTFYVRRYLCKYCNKKFTTSLDAIVKKGHQHAKIYQKHIQESYKTGYCSFRHLKKIFQSIYGNSPSHQTIYNWMQDTHSKSTSSDASKYSGYYCYDEQYLRLDKQRFYRLSLIDSVFNKPVIEEIVDNLQYKTVKSFIEKATSDKPIHVISTDHRQKYKRIMDELEINHQLCIFHLYKQVGNDVYKKLKSKFIKDCDKIRMCIVFTEIKEIFRTFDFDIAMQRLDLLLSSPNEIQNVFHKHVQKIIRDFERLTLFMRDGMVSKTTNPIENYYRQTMPYSLKRIFKTPRGTLNFLDMRKDYWINNISINV